METQVTIPLWLLDRALQCIARAQFEGAFRGCAVPSIGIQTLNALESYKIAATSDKRKD